MNVKRGRAKMSGTPPEDTRGFIGKWPGGVARGSSPGEMHPGIQHGSLYHSPDPKLHHGIGSNPRVKSCAFLHLTHYNRISISLICKMPGRKLFLTVRDLENQC